MKRTKIKALAFFLILLCIVICIIRINAEDKTALNATEQAAAKEADQTEEICEVTENEQTTECDEATEYEEEADKSDEVLNFVNPYFYSQTECFLSADITYIGYELLTTVNGELKLQWLKEYNNGNLYKLTVEPVSDITRCLGEERLNIYFYVTADNIYRLWSWVVQNKEVIAFYDDDALLMEILDTDEKLVENGELVCCMDEKTDELELSEIGSHVVIIQGEEKITYNRVDIGANGNRDFYEDFVWEKGKGLVEYKSGYRMEAEILYIENISME